MTSLVPTSSRVLFLIGLIYIVDGDDDLGTCTHLLSDRKPFSVIWNAPTGGCHYSQYNDTTPLNSVLTKWGITDNRKNAWYGDKILTLYSVGAFPYFHNGSYNGEILQLPNLAHHLKKFKRDIIKVIPNPNFTGVAVIDYEGWRPIWIGNFGGKKWYQNRFKELVKKNFPDMSEADINRKAEKDFDAAARLVLSETLSLAKSLRPKGHWGYYAYPRCYGACAKKAPLPATWWDNDKIDYVWEASTALLPSIYYDKPDRHVNLYDHLRETLRVKTKYNYKNIPILPFAFNFKGEDRLKEVIGIPAEMGVDGVILWGSSNILHKHNCYWVRNYVDTILGPYVKNITQRFSACSHLVCNSRGRCVQNDLVTDYTFEKNATESCRSNLRGLHDTPYHVPDDIGNYTLNDFDNYSCYCVEGWKGKNCDVED